MKVCKYKLALNASRKPSVPASRPAAIRPDGVDFFGVQGKSQQNAPPPGPGLTVAGGSMTIGAGLGVALGLAGGMYTNVATFLSVPGLALSGAIIGAQAMEKWGDPMSEYRDVDGVIFGAMAGFGAGMAQSYLVSGGNPIAVSLGISGCLIGLAGALASSE